MGSFTPGDGVSVQGNAGGNDQSRTSLKSTVPPENSARLKLTRLPVNSTSSKLTWPPVN